MNGDGDRHPVLDLVMTDANDVIAFVEPFEYLHETALPHPQPDFRPSSRVVLHTIDETLVALWNHGFFRNQQGIRLFTERQIDVGEESRSEFPSGVRHVGPHTDRTA